MDEELLNINLENKIRMIVSDILNPFIGHMNEQQQSSKKLEQSFKKQQFTIEHLSNEIHQNINQSVPFHEFKKRIESIETNFSSEVGELRFDINSTKLKNDSHSLIISDLNTKVKFLEDKLKDVLASSEYNFKYIREFRDSISLESTKSILAMKSFIDGQKDLNDTISEKISKVSQSILEINSKGFPQVYTQIERRNVEISELKIFIKELQADRVVSDDIVRLKSKLDTEVWKLSDRFLKELEEIKSFLHEMLRDFLRCVRHFTESSRQPSDKEVDSSSRKPIERRSSDIRGLVRKLLKSQASLNRFFILKGLDSNKSFRIKSCRVQGKNQQRRRRRTTKTS
jgi:hypothetical protein